MFLKGSNFRPAWGLKKDGSVQPEASGTAGKHHHYPPSQSASNVCGEVFILPSWKKNFFLWFAVTKKLNFPHKSFFLLFPASCLPNIQCIWHIFYFTTMYVRLSVCQPLVLVG